MGGSRTESGQCKGVSIVSKETPRQFLFCLLNIKAVIFFSGGLLPLLTTVKVLLLPESPLENRIKSCCLHTIALDQIVFTGKFKQLNCNWNSLSTLFPTVGNREVQLMTRLSFAAAFARPGDDRRVSNMRRAQVCTLPFSSQQKPLRPRRNQQVAALS